LSAGGRLGEQSQVAAIGTFLRFAALLLVASGYQLVFGLALIGIGVGLICGALISQLREQSEAAEPNEVADLRDLLDSLPRVDEEFDARPRFDRIRNRNSMG
jgi:hypothetical protein